MDNTLPPLPEGATLDQPANGLPPLPPGATLDTPATTTVAKTSQGPAMAPPPAFRAGPSAHAARYDVDEPKPSAWADWAQRNGIGDVFSQGYQALANAATGGAGAPLLQGPGGAELAKGVPVLGATVPQTAEMSQFEKAQPELAQAYQIAGGITSTAPLAALAPGAFGAGATQGLGSRLAAGALSNAAIAGADTYARTGDQEKAIRDAGIAALTAGGITLGTSAVGSVVKPTISAAAQALDRAGIRLTPGQILGGNAKRAEDVAQSYPFAGMMVRNARSQAASDVQRVAGNEALRPTGLTLKPGVEPGEEMMADLIAKKNAAYAQAHENLTLKSTPEFRRANEAIYEEAVKRKLPPDKLAILRNAIDETIDGQLGTAGAAIRGENIQSITSTLSSDAHNLSLAQGDYWSSRTGQLLKRLQKNTEALMEKQNPATIGAWKAAQEMYPMYKTIETAAGMAGGPKAQYSANQLFRAGQKGQTASVQATASGPLSGLAGAAQEIIPAKVPDSGTPERAVMMAAWHGLGGVGHATAAGLAPHMLIPGGVIAGLYSPPVQWALRKAILSYPETRQVLRNILQQYATPAIQAANRPVAANGSNQ